MDDREKTLQMMHRLMKAIKTEDGVIEPHIALPALNFTVGYVLGQALEDGVDHIELAEVYSQVIKEVDYARQTATAVVATYDAIEKARHSLFGGFMHDENFLRDVCVVVVSVVVLMVTGAALAYLALAFVPPFWRLLFF
jgi:hypothetical protein